MSEQPFDHRRRSSVAMYDPARDMFMAAEEAIDEPDGAAARSPKPTNEHKEQRKDFQSDSIPAIDGQQINSSVPSRASLNSPGPGIVHSDGDCAVGSPESLRGKDAKPNPRSQPSSNQGSETRRHTSSPRAINHSSSPLPPLPEDTDSIMAAPPPKKRKLSSSSPPPGRSPAGRDTPPIKKRDTSASKDVKSNGDVKAVRESMEKPTYSKKRVPEKSQKNTRRPRHEQSAYSRRDTPPPRERSRSPRQRSPEYRERDGRRRRSRSPRPISRSPSRSPPRQRKKPGGGARLDPAAKEAIRRRQAEREEVEQRQGQQIARERGVHDLVRQHYNAVPERGREWRKTDSRIKGLRSFNNWIKSTIIQKFSPNEDFTSRGEKDWGGYDDYDNPKEKGLLVLDIGCGKGGDLGKWQQASQPLELYVGIDPAEVSISQARDRYLQMQGGRGPRGARPKPLFHSEFFVKDCFGEWLGELPFVQNVGIDGNVGPGENMMASRWGGGGGFDVVSMMFCMHYAFESEEKARGMLRNVAGSLKKGGRFLGVIPNSDVLSAKVKEFHDKRKEKEKHDDENEEGEVEEEVPEWGNSIYRIRFPGKTPEDGIFRPPFGWKYSYFLEEAVEEVPEYVVPWEAFRAMTEDYNLEMQYRKPFPEIWTEEKDDRILGPLSERMGVRGRGAGPLLVGDEEMDAASFYHAFCFYKV